MAKKKKSKVLSPTKRLNSISNENINVVQSLGEQNQEIKDKKKEVPSTGILVPANKNLNSEDRSSTSRDPGRVVGGVREIDPTTSSVPQTIKEAKRIVESASELPKPPEEEPKGNDEIIPEVTSKEEIDSVSVSLAEKQKKKEKRRRGRRSTILTSPQGVLESSQIRRRTLLGV